MFLAVCFSKLTHDTSQEDGPLEYNASLTRQSSLLDESHCGITVYMLPEFLHPPKCIEQVHINTASLIQNPYPNVTEIYGPIPSGPRVGSCLPKYRNFSKRILPGHTGSCKEDI